MVMQHVPVADHQIKKKEGNWAESWLSFGQGFDYFSGGLIKFAIAIGILVSIYALFSGMININTDTGIELAKTLIPFFTK